MSNNIFIDLTEELYNKGWTVYWEFNSNIDPALLKYNHCITVEDCATVNSEYAYDVDGNGAWNYRLDNLEDAENMFVVDASGSTPIGSPALVSFNADLPKVTTGAGAFAGCSNLTTFNGDLSNLSDCMTMFANCPKLTSFTSDLSSLTMAMFMFGGNYETVRRYVCDVILGIDISEITPEEESFLEFYIDVFLQMISSHASLDVASVQNIAATINNISGITPPADLDPEMAAMWGRIDIGIDPTLEGNSEIEAALTTIRNKGWNVTPMYDDEYVTPGEGLLKYNNCKTYRQCWMIDANVATDVDENGAWNYYLDNLENGNGLFIIDLQENTPNTSLVSFNVDLPNLTNGERMFNRCTNLTSWAVDLPNLTNGRAMFSHCPFTSWTIDLPNLTNGEDMFYNCTGLTSCTIPLPNLTDGNWMFSGCTNLTSFSGDLSSLTQGRCMFGFSTSKCTKLDLASVQHIANTINDLTGKTPENQYYWGQIHIGISSSIQDTPELEEALAAIVAKGWTVDEIYA